MYTQELNTQNAGKKQVTPLESFIEEFNNQNNRLYRNIDRLVVIKQRLVNEPEDASEKKEGSHPDNGYFPKMKNVLNIYSSMNTKLESLLERLDNMI